jgi:hypothetical protein
LRFLAPLWVDRRPDLPESWFDFSHQHILRLEFWLFCLTLSFHRIQHSILLT